MSLRKRQYTAKYRQVLSDFLINNFLIYKFPDLIGSSHYICISQLVCSENQLTALIWLDKSVTYFFIKFIEQNLPKQLTVSANCHLRQINSIQSFLVLIFYKHEFIMNIKRQYSSSPQITHFLSVLTVKWKSSSNLCFDSIGKSMKADNNNK